MPADGRAEPLPTVEELIAELSMRLKHHDLQAVRLFERLASLIGHDSCRPEVIAIGEQIGRLHFTKASKLLSQLATTLNIPCEEQT